MRHEVKKGPVILLEEKRGLEMRSLIVVLALMGLSLVAKAGYPLRVEAVQEADGVWAIVAHNAGSAPVFVHVTLKNKVNVRYGGMSATGPKALEPGAKETLIVAVPEKQEEQMSFDFDTKWVFGRGHGRGEPLGVYRPPFPADMTFETINSAGAEQVGGEDGEQRRHPNA